MKIKEVLNYLEQRFPYELAADFDYNKIGLTIGDETDELKNVICALDLTHEVIDEAIKKDCNLIITHHPFTFSPITKILKKEEKGSLIYRMIENGISLIAMHTNMDLGFGGVNDSLCELLNLKNSNYGANLKNEYIRYGNIKKQTLKEFALYTKNILKLNGVKVIGDLDKTIEKVGILGGSGGHESDIERASLEKCDCYITGEIKHHIGLLAKFKDLCLIEVDHGIEKVVFDKLSKDIEEQLKIEVYVSEANSNLFEYL